MFHLSSDRVTHQGTLPSRVGEDLTFAPNDGALARFLLFGIPQWRKVGLDYRSLGSFDIVIPYHAMGKRVLMVMIVSVHLL